MNCDYCGKKAERVPNEEIYGKRFGKSYMMWLCRPCKAYVGCHNNTYVPLGRMANAELREWKKKAHATFDPLWKSGKMTRKDAYKLLQQKMNLSNKQCHIGMFDIDDCKRLIEVIAY